MLKDTVQDKDQGSLRWQEIDWKQVTRTVRQLQSRMVKAEKEGNSAKAQRLRSLLLHSLSAKFLAVRQVVSNRGKRTPGVDGIVWNTPQAKMQAVMQLVRKEYRAYPLRRVYIIRIKLRSKNTPLLSLMRMGATLPPYPTSRGKWARHAHKKKNMREYNTEKDKEGRTYARKEAGGEQQGHDET